MKITSVTGICLRVPCAPIADALTCSQARQALLIRIDTDSGLYGIGEAFTYGAPLSAIDVSNALRGVPVFELKDGGADVEELLGAGSPAELLKMRNEFCVSLEQLLAKVLPDGERRKDSLELPVADREEKRRGRHAGRRWGRRKS